MSIILNNAKRVIYNYGWKDLAKLKFEQLDIYIIPDKLNEQKEWLFNRFGFDKILTFLLSLLKRRECYVILNKINVILKKN